MVESSTEEGAVGKSVRGEEGSCLGVRGKGTFSNSSSSSTAVQMFRTVSSLQRALVDMNPAVDNYPNDGYDPPIYERLETMKHDDCAKDKAPLTFRLTRLSRECDLSAALVSK